MHSLTLDVNLFFTVQ